MQSALYQVVSLLLLEAFPHWVSPFVNGVTPMWSSPSSLFLLLLLLLSLLFTWKRKKEILWGSHSVTPPYGPEHTMHWCTSEYIRINNFNVAHNWTSRLTTVNLWLSLRLGKHYTSLSFSITNRWRNIYLSRLWILCERTQRPGKAPLLLICLYMMETSFSY